MAAAPISDKQRDERVVVGRVGGAYGVKGWVHLTSFTEPPDNLLGYRPWFLQPDASNAPPAGGTRGPSEAIAVEDARPHGDDFVVKFVGCEDRGAAEALRGMLLAVDAAVLPALGDDEFYQRELIGMSVIGDDAVVLGELTGFMSGGGSDVMVLRGANGERLVPFAAQVVQEVDRASRRIRVAWPADWLAPDN